MVFGVKVKYKGRMDYGRRRYKTEAGAKRSIASPAGQAFIRKHKLTGVKPYKKRK